MKTKVKPYVLAVLSFLLILGIAPTAQAEIFAYFVSPQTKTINFNPVNTSASGTNIAIFPFMVDTTLYSGAVFSFSFVDGDGTFSIMQGSTLLFSGSIDDALIEPIYSGGNLTYYQILGPVNPDTSGSPLYTFDHGQFNLTFFPNGAYNGGYFQTFDESETPIPGAAWLLGTGLFGLIAIRRRRKA